MATGMSSIFISGAEGKTTTRNFPNDTFDKTTISELKLQIITTRGIDPDNLRLLYAGQELQSVMHGKEMTFEDYKISNSSTIILYVRMPVGGCLPVRFADVSSEDSFKEVKLTHSGGHGRLTIDRGINFEGTCKYKSCKAKNETVIIQRGFYKESGGICMLNYEITQLKCPMCKHTLDKNEVHGVGVYKAKLEVKSKEEGSNEVVVNIEARDKFLYAGCMDDRDKVDYEYVILKVTRFKGYLFQ